MRLICKKPDETKCKKIKKKGKDYSLNGVMPISSKTKLVIVGTITPPENKGFYYTTRNDIYGYIDDAFEKTNLKEKASQLRDCSKTERKQIIDSMIDDLNSVGIAFLDVAKCVVRKKGESADKYIEEIELDYNAFKKIGSINILCNSLDARECLYEILYKNKNTRPKITYLPRRCGSRNNWINTLKELTK